MKITWKDFDEAAHEIDWKFQHSNITTIVGLQRGGLPLAVKLSNLMDMPMKVLDYQTRDGKTTMEELSDRLFDLDILVSETLFVDDMCDSGKTIKDIQCLYPDARFAVLCTRRKDLVEFSPIEIDEADESWIEFPWEK